MRYGITVIVLYLFALSSFAASFSSRIYAIDKGKAGQPDLLMMENGRTAFLKQSEKQLLPSLNTIETYEVTLDKKLNVISLRPATPEESSEVQAPLNPRSTYEPSVITPEAASAAFKNMSRGYRHRSQCYNRAHVWTYEEFKRTGVKSGKLFLFFTSRYIRNFNYEWWFHVTPMAFVGGLDQSNWMTLDRLFNRAPLATKAWTDQFMRNKTSCPVVQKYADYRNHQDTQDCYIIQKSMYYWQPRDIETFDKTGYEKTDFIDWEINHAYRQAF